MTIHYDVNGRPCGGKYVGLIIDDYEPIFQTAEEQEYYKSKEFYNKTVEYYLLKNSYGSI